LLLCAQTNEQRLGKGAHRALHETLHSTHGERV
jgi:hypothetical protein